LGTGASRPGIQHKGPDSAGTAPKAMTDRRVSQNSPIVSHLRPCASAGRSYQILGLRFGAGGRVEPGMRQRDRAAFEGAPTAALAERYRRVVLVHSDATASKPASANPSAKGIAGAELADYGGRRGCSGRWLWGWLDRCSEITGSAQSHLAALRTVWGRRILHWSYSSRRD